MRMTPAIALLIVSFGLPACASKGFVGKNVKVVDDKVESLSASVKDNENRIARTEDTVAGVRQEAQAAQRSATRAQSTAETAADAAAQANARAEEVDRNARKLVYEVVLSADEANFKFDNTALPDQAKLKLDEMVDQIKAEPQSVYFEIEGYTDSSGDELYNEKLGMQRAEAVKRYLYEQHNIPLHRINTISYGEANPVAPNDDREGRAKNRRVVVKVLS